MANTARVDGAYLESVSSVMASPRVDGAWLDVVTAVVVAARVDGAFLEIVTAQNVSTPAGGIKLAGEPLYLGRELGVRLFSFGDL